MLIIKREYEFIPESEPDVIVFIRAMTEDEREDYQVNLSQLASKHETELRKLHAMKKKSKSIEMDQIPDLSIATEMRDLQKDLYFKCVKKINGVVDGKKEAIEPEKAVQDIWNHCKVLRTEICNNLLEGITEEEKKK